MGIAPKITYLFLNALFYLWPFLFALFPYNYLEIPMSWMDNMLISFNIFNITSTLFFIVLPIQGQFKKLQDKKILYNYIFIIFTPIILYNILFFGNFNDTVYNYLFWSGTFYFIWTAIIVFRTLYLHRKIYE